MTPLAHSAASPERTPQSYVEHVQAVRKRAIVSAAEMSQFAHLDEAGLVQTVQAAATFHDLGKLDPDNQAALKKGRSAALLWDHIDAGVAHLSAVGNHMAAWIVRAHHAPGLPERAHHFTDQRDPRLRGRRRDSDDLDRHERQINRTDKQLSTYLACHEAVVGALDVEPMFERHGVAMRLALSCLVDADHSDTARFDTGIDPPEPLAGRWAERLAALDRYIDGLPSTASERDLNRAAFYRDCRIPPLLQQWSPAMAPSGSAKRQRSPPI